MRKPRRLIDLGEDKNVNDNDNAAGVASARRRGRNAKMMMIEKIIEATAAMVRGKARGMCGKLDLMMLPC